MRFSSLATDNLREYMLYAVSTSGWTTHRIGNLVLTINGRPDSLFNYVFPMEGTYEECESSAREALDYLAKEKIDTTWVVDSHTKEFGVTVNKLGFTSPTVVKKAFMKIPAHTYTRNHSSNLVLEAVSTDSALAELDCMASKIFYCNMNDLAILLRGMVRRQPSDLKFFLTKLHGATVGLCGMYIHDQVVGLYSDGVLPEYRNMGIASDMVSQRLEMAREQYGCRYAVAQCMKQSLGVYGRLGFRITGNLSLYASLMA
ncbi:GNAT family N-acetyltransferase [Anaplasma capra]|uniref:GNAT family N-acetyltransferase n=1 Tax=Anaplasma capra TaxID=1562740 RepID=UPI0021D5FB41|nr:GNAT family N-acetyltransferase [Anaplasma capra]MCU7611362.1 GNAT family N-acetyltransferase [Anaplasma capra]MCU7612436.1 GNAT family N-acetyltransferase [Anaplasma capra]